MINTEKLEKILKKKRDKIPTLLEILRLTANLCKIPADVFDTNFNIAFDKVENLLFLQMQSKKTAGYVLTDSDYKALGIFENHMKKQRRKSKPSQKLNNIIKLMPKLEKIKRERHLNYRELQAYVEKRYKLHVSRTYFIKIFKKINF